MNRRGFLSGLAGVLAAGVMPAFVRSDSLMRLYIPARPKNPLVFTVEAYGFNAPNGGWGSFRYVVLMPDVLGKDLPQQETLIARVDHGNKIIAQGEIFAITGDRGLEGGEYIQVNGY